MCFSFVFLKERDTAAHIAKADPYRGQKMKRWGRRGGGEDGKKTKLFAVCLLSHSSPSFFSFCPFLNDLRLDFFLIQKGRRSA